MRHSQGRCIVLLGAEKNCPGRDGFLQTRELQGCEESFKEGQEREGTPQLPGGGLAGKRESAEQLRMHAEEEHTHRRGGRRVKKRPAR